jgi:hypothetical protein
MGNSAEMSKFAASSGMTDRHDVHVFSFLSSLEFPIFDNTEMTNFAASGAMTGHLDSHYVHSFLFLSSIEFPIFDNTEMTNK